MTLIDFVKMFLDHYYKFNVILEWYWIDDGLDEEYSFEGSPAEFVQHYTKEYDCIDGVTIFDVSEIKVINEGSRSRIYIEIRRE